MKKRIAGYLFVSCALLLCSCDKGYRIRCSNYYTEPMDSVKIGSKIVFTNVEIHAASEFADIKRGHYNITFITSSKKMFYSSIFIPGQGEGNRTVQIDAAEQISILEE